MPGKFKVGDAVVSNEEDDIAFFKGAKWVGRVERVQPTTYKGDDGKPVVEDTIHTLGYFLKGTPKPGGKAPKYTRRALPETALDLLKS
jgi:hypothetical protein